MGAEIVHPIPAPQQQGVGVLIQDDEMVGKGGVSRESRAGYLDELVRELGRRVRQPGVAQGPPQDEDEGQEAGFETHPRGTLPGAPHGDGSRERDSGNAS